MVFSNIFFLYVFLPALFLAYFVIKNNAYRRAVLIAFSLVFYAWGEPVYVFLMIGLVLADYIFGLLISKTRQVWLRKFWLVIAIVSNLSILGVYKYLGFFTETLNFIFNVTIPVIKLSMPIGISFFTFQTMSYVIDVYRGDADVQKSFFRLLLYVSFFPQLVAGPIVRYKDIEMQLSDRQVSLEKLNDGMFRFSVGLVKKVLIADCCDTAITALLSLSDVTFAGRWAAALFFTLQLYFDFSGYSDMAIGLGRMFGFEFLENFNYPLVSRSATEFWRRWHMSLGSFFRDYVYIPLGGNRHDQQRNILVVWFLTGLWHGAAWNFILWGLYYGFLLMWEKKHYLKQIERMPKVISFVISHIYTIFITVFGFAIFYFEKDLFKNLGYLFGIGCKSVSDIFTTSIVMDNVLLLAAACLFSAPVVPALWKWLKEHAKIGYTAERIIKTVCVIAFVSVSTIRLVGDTYSAFLYFRF